MKSARIAIVGMGAVGTTTCIQLVNKLRRRDLKIEIHCFEKTGRVGPGLAYSTDKKFHILNTPANTMSIDPENPDDFPSWLVEKEIPGPGPNSRDKFPVPRLVFGQYLNERWQQTLESLDGDRIKVILHESEVADCEDDRGEVVVWANGQKMAFDHVILCLGHLKSKRHRYGIPDCDRFIENPWQSNAFDQIGGSCRIGILGTSLTAIDTLFSVIDHQDSAGTSASPIKLFSRTRGLPKSQTYAQPIKLEYLTLETIATMTNGFTSKIKLVDFLPLLEREFNRFPSGELLWKEYLDTYFPNGYPEHVPAAKLSRSYDDMAATSSREDHVGWHTILDATADIAPYLWFALEEEEKTKFITKYESIWAMFRHSAPPFNSAKLTGLASSRKIEVVNGIYDVTFDADRQQFHVFCNDNGETTETVVDYLIDSTGTELDVHELHSELVENLLKRGLLTAHPLGGFSVDFESSRLIDRNEAVSPRLRYVGIHSKGTHFYTNSYEMNRANVAKIVHDLANELSI